MGDEFIKVQYELIPKEIPNMDIVITTALILGKPAPMLISSGMIFKMKPGSVDLAAQRGGNADGCVTREHITTDNGVHIVGYTDLNSRLSKYLERFHLQKLIMLLNSLGKTHSLQIKDL